jgi:DNA-binding MarR family transcriptional regulator
VDDRRIVNLSLTAAGHAVATALMPRTMEFWNDMLEGFADRKFKAPRSAVLIRGTTRV